MIQRIAFKNLLTGAKHHFVLKLIGQMHMFHQSPSLNEFLDFKQSPNYIQTMTINWINQINLTYKPKFEDKECNQPIIESEHIGLYFKTLNKIIDDEMRLFMKKMKKSSSKLNQYDIQQKSSCLRQQIEKNMRRMLHLETKKNRNQNSQSSNLYELSQIILDQYQFLAQKIEKKIVQFDFQSAQINEKGETFGIVEQICKTIDDHEFGYTKDLKINSQCKAELKRLFSIKGELNFTPYLQGQDRFFENSLLSGENQKYGTYFVPSRVTSTIIKQLQQMINTSLVTGAKRIGKSHSFLLAAMLRWYQSNLQIILFCNHKQFLKRKVVIERIFEGCWRKLTQQNIDDLKKYYQKDQQKFQIQQIMGIFETTVEKQLKNRGFKIIIDQIQTYFQIQKKQLLKNPNRMKYFQTNLSNFQKLFLFFSASNYKILFGTSVSVQENFAILVFRQRRDTYQSHRIENQFSINQMKYLLTVWYHNANNLAQRKNEKYQDGQKDLALVKNEKHQTEQKDVTHEKNEKNQVQQKNFDMRVINLIKGYLFQQQALKFKPHMAMTDLIKAASLLIEGKNKEQLKKLQLDEAESKEHNKIKEDWMNFSIQFWKEFSMIKVKDLSDKIDQWITKDHQNNNSGLISGERIAIIEQLLRTRKMRFGPRTTSNIQIPLFLCDFNGQLFKNLHCIQQVLYFNFLEKYSTLFVNNQIYAKIQNELSS